MNPAKAQSTQQLNYLMSVQHPAADEQMGPILAHHSDKSKNEDDHDAICKINSNVPSRGRKARVILTCSDVMMGRVDWSRSQK